MRRGGMSLALWAGLAAAPGAVVAQVTIHAAGCGDDAWSGLHAACIAPDGPKRTIQAAIDAAADGDTVLVADGEYTGEGNFDLNLRGRRIVVRSSGGAASCTIDVQGNAILPRRGFVVTSGESAQSVIEGFTIVGGYAAHGGAVLIEGSSPEFRGCIFDQCTAHPAPGSGMGGGAVSIIGGSPAFVDCTFRESRVLLGAGAGLGAGGGALRSHAASPRLVRCLFAGNIAPGMSEPEPGVGGGAVMALAGGELEFEACELIENESSADGGGVLIIGTGARLTDCRLAGNRARSGAGYLAILGGSSILLRCTFVGNIAERCCGGMAVHDSFAEIAESEFVGNAAYADAGGGVLVQRYADVRLRDVRLMENSAREGGGVWIGDAGLVTADRIWLEANRATRGGGAALVRSGTMEATNIIAARNIADNGAALSLESSALATVINATLVLNSAAAGAGGVRLRDAGTMLRLYNSIVWFNQGMPGAVSISAQGAAPDVRSSNIEGGWAGGGNISIPPRFVSLWAGDLRLAPDSPGIDGGGSGLVPSGVLVDIAGEARFSGSGVDMGAHEHQVALCPANCDGSTIAPVLNMDDFSCFINEFAAGQLLSHAQQTTHYANCDGSTVAPALNVDDFACFVNAFAAGCP